MESFHWDKGFLTHIHDVDDQHHHLVDVINRFGELVSESDSINFQDVQEVLRELKDYTHYHFSEEEAFMEASGIDPSHLSPHKEAHQNFINEVLEMEKVITPESLDKCERVMKFLTHWLAYHILGTDKSMARQVEMIGQGYSPADAWAEELKRHKESSTGPLLNALDGLFKQVTERNQELSELNRTLEQRVEERTKDLAQANRKLEVIALTDVLTGLPNRRHAMQVFEDLWNASIAAGQPISCMMIDADGFKQINDTYGHDAGDEVLKQLSQKLKDSVRNDDITARLGGDEFLIICPNTDLNGALYIAEQTRKAVSEMRVPAGKDGVWKGSVSVGVSCIVTGMKAFEDLIKAADNGVYIAKEDGRNCVRTADSKK